MNSACPQCNSKSYKRNGYTRHGKQNHRCLDCGRQFSLEPAPLESQPLHYSNVEPLLRESVSTWKDALKY